MPSRVGRVLRAGEQRGGGWAQRRADGAVKSGLLPTLRLLVFLCLRGRDGSGRSRQLPAQLRSGTSWFVHLPGDQCLPQPWLLETPLAVPRRRWHRDALGSMPIEAASPLCLTPLRPSQDSCSRYADKETEALRLRNVLKASRWC